MTGLGFNEELPFEIKMAESQFSNTDGIETEIQLADSGYGQGQILVNPLHMACIYSAFCNEGNIIKPYLVYQNEAEIEYWIPGAFSNETASRVLEGTKKVVNDSTGTGYAAHRDDIVLAGKTGTAEIKASKEDTSDTLCQGCLRNFFALFKLFCTIIQNKPLNLIGHRFLARFAEMQLDTIGCLSNPLYHNGLLCTLCGQRGSGRGGGAGVGFVAHRLSFQR